MCCVIARVILLLVSDMSGGGGGGGGYGLNYYSWVGCSLERYALHVFILRPFVAL